MTSPKFSWAWKALGSSRTSLKSAWNTGIWVKMVQSEWVSGGFSIGDNLQQAMIAVTYWVGLWRRFLCVSGATHFNAVEIYQQAQQNIEDRFLDIFTRLDINVPKGHLTINFSFLPLHSTTVITLPVCQCIYLFFRFRAESFLTLMIIFEHYYAV